MGGVLVLGLGEGRAGADAAPCTAVQLLVDQGLDPAFRPAMDTLREDLARLPPPECVEMEIHIARGAHGLSVRARAPDGREGERSVDAPEDLVPVVLGLVAVAPREVERTEPAPPTTTQPSELPTFDVPQKSVAPAPSNVNVLLEGSAGVRYGIPTLVTMADLELRVDLAVHDWLVLLSFRNAPFGASPKNLLLDDDSYSETAVGLGFGRRLRWGVSTFDVTLTPSIAFVSMEQDQPTEASGSRDQFRFDGAVRWGYPVGTTWRFTATLDSELAPHAVVRNTYVEPTHSMAAMPAWTVGLRLGASATLL